MKKCNNCGMEQSDEALFCEECGTRLENNDSGMPVAMPETVSDSKPELSSEPVQGSIQSTPEITPAPEPKTSATFLPPTDRFAPVNQIVKRVDEQSEQIEQPAEQSEQAVEQPVAQPEQVADQLAAELEQQPTEQPLEQPIEQPEDAVTEQSVEVAIAQPEDVAIDQPVMINQTKPVKTNSNKTLRIILIVVCIVLVAISAVGIVMANINSGPKNKTSSTNSSNSSNTNSSSQQSSSNNSTENNVVAVSVAGWEFLIPEEYDYKLSDGTLTVYGEDNAWAARIGYDNSIYANIVADTETVENLIAGNGYKIAKSGFAAFGGEEYYWFDIDISQTGEKGIFALTQAPDMGTFTIVLVDVDNSQDHSALTSVSEILNTAVKSDSN